MFLVKDWKWEPHGFTDFVCLGEHRCPQPLEYYRDGGNLVFRRLCTSLSSERDIMYPVIHLEGKSFYVPGTERYLMPGETGVDEDYKPYNHVAIGIFSGKKYRILVPLPKECEYTGSFEVGERVRITRNTDTLQKIVPEDLLHKIRGREAEIMEIFPHHYIVQVRGEAAEQARYCLSRQAIQKIEPQPCRPERKRMLLWYCLTDNGTWKPFPEPYTRGCFPDSVQYALCNKAAYTLSPGGGHCTRTDLDLIQVSMMERTTIWLGYWNDGPEV